MFYGGEPISILDRLTRQLRSKHIDLVKVHWIHRPHEEVIIEVEPAMCLRYPNILTPLGTLFRF